MTRQEAEEKIGEAWNKRILLMMPDAEGENVRRQCES